MKRLTKHRWGVDVAVRMIADGVVINLGLAYVMAVRFVWLITMEKGSSTTQAALDLYLDIYFHYSCVLLVVSLPIFYLCGLYTYARLYQLKYKLMAIFQAVTLAYLVVAFVSLVFFHTSTVLPRSVLLMTWLLTFVLLVSTRLWSSLWKYLAREEEHSAPIRMISDDEKRKVLLIGGAGYIGSAVLPKLLEKGYHVRLLDVLLFGKEPVIGWLNHPRVELIQGDFRHIDQIVCAVRGVDSIVHLGGIVGDPACSLDETLTIDVNLIASRMIAEVAKGAGVGRLVFASTCSVYGHGNELLSEQSALSPLSLYARSKLACEKLLLGIANGSSLKPVILRFGTIYGLSGRIRFDLVVNLLTAKAVFEGKITVFNGDQWRPFVHVDDAAAAVTTCIEAHEDIVGSQIFNVGSNGQNFRIEDVGRIIHEAVPHAEIVSTQTDGDRRDYRVDFTKIHRVLHFEPKWRLEAGVRQIIDACTNGRIVDYRDPLYSNYKFFSNEGVVAMRTNEQNWVNELLYEDSSPDAAIEVPANRPCTRFSRRTG